MCVCGRVLCSLPPPRAYASPTPKYIEGAGAKGCVREQILATSSIRIARSSYQFKRSGARPWCILRSGVYCNVRYIAAAGKLRRSAVLHELNLSMKRGAWPGLLVFLRQTISGNAAKDDSVDPSYGRWDIPLFHYHRV